ncbi:MAG: dihydrofolate reductase [Sphingobacteriales bacterium]|nr:dihydrofolate reductase [Sphingobacteriales bacterium]
MKISIVVVADENNAIGKNNQLLCHLPADLKHFKSITTGNTVVMGRKTFDSIGKPLPNRKNIVITRQPNLAIEGCEVVQSLQEAIQSSADNTDVCIIGGAEIYNQSLELTDVIYLTRIHHEFEADAFFPPIDSEIWEQTSIEPHQPDEKNKYSYSFITYNKR